MFRGIQKGEWLNLFTFIRQKRLRIENLREAEAGPQGPGLAMDLGADIDTGRLAGRTPPVVRVYQICTANFCSVSSHCAK